MKKKLLVAIVILMVVALTSIICCYRMPSVGLFSLEDYNQKIEQFSREESFGEIRTAQEAINVAKILWKEQYEDIYFYMPYRVFYDDINHVWLVRGSMCFVFPSGPFLLISEKEGKVLAVWNEKF